MSVSWAGISEKCGLPRWAAGATGWCREREEARETGFACRNARRATGGLQPQIVHTLPSLSAQSGGGITGKCEKFGVTWSGSGTKGRRGGACRGLGGWFGWCECGEEWPQKTQEVAKRSFVVWEGGWDHCALGQFGTGSGNEGPVCRQRAQGHDARGDRPGWSAKVSFRRRAYGGIFATDYFFGGAAFFPAPSAGWAVTFGVAAVVPA